MGVALFTIAFVTHLALLTKYRTWYFTPLAVGTFMEIVGYVFRLLSSQQDPYNVIWFVIQYFFIVVAPVLFSAAIYTIVSILINTYGREYSPLPPKIILWSFVTFDVIATIVQVAGAALVGTSYSNQRDPTTANNILLGGLAFQVFCFGVFLIILGLTLYRARRSPVKVATSFLVALVIGTLAIYLRTCFRLAETAEGLMATLSTHEVYFGCLEFAPVVVAAYGFAYWHPGRWLQDRGNTHREKTADRLQRDSA